MIALDCETNGLDFRHGCKPFMVTTCNEQGEQRYWEWQVDPLTRLPDVPPGDVEEIGEYLFGGDRYDHVKDPGYGLVLQNPKFDFTALGTIGLWNTWDVDSAWDMVKDTLLAAHLLASNRPKDLTSLGIQYLGVNMERYELALEDACKKARARCRSAHKEWLIAREGHPNMPSAKSGGKGEKDKLWKNDTWLPKALAQAEGYADDHPWHTVLRDYANADSEMTMALWPVMRDEIKRRGLWKIYLERLKLLPIAYDMEANGVTVSGPRLASRRTEYAADAARCSRVCVNIAATYDDGGTPYALEMGKATNNSLRRFCFEVMNLRPIRGKKARTDNPSLDKNVMAYYLATLPSRSKQLAFVTNLMDMRSRNTAVTYMEAYERFWLPLGVYNEAGEQLWFRLHPSLNPTGSDTLRWSSSNPNEQNISKKESFNVRYCFGPAPGREWWSLDGKNLELRLPFYKCGQPELIALFERPDDPPYYGSNHLANFHAVFPEVWAEVEKEMGWEKVGPTCKKRFAATYYQRTKNGGFAKQYGAGRDTTDATFGKRGAYDLLESKFDKLSEYNRYWISFANRKGYVETIPDKTVDPERGYPLLCTRTEHGSVLGTVPLSYHIQGSAMWWMGKGMVRCHGHLRQWNRKGFDGFITMQVHDEMVFDFPRRAHPLEDPKRSNLTRIKVMQRLMEQGGDDLGVPTPVGIEWHPDNWSEGVTV